MSYYADVSRQIQAIFHRYTPLVEPLSLDEAFLDTTGSEHLFGSPVEIGRKIKADIRQELGLVASVGVAPVRFVAKIASDLEKPDGFVVVEADAVQAFLDPLPVSSLLGVGKVSGQTFAKLGICTIGELRKRPSEVGEVIVQIQLPRSATTAARAASYSVVPAPLPTNCLCLNRREADPRSPVQGKSDIPQYLIDIRRIRMYYHTHAINSKRPRIQAYTRKAAGRSDAPGKPRFRYGPRTRDWD